MSEIIYREESYKIVGACFEVYKNKGCGFTEPLYQECLGIEFGLQAIPFTDQPSFELEYKGTKLVQSFRPDLLCFGSIIFELKGTIINPAYTSFLGINGMIHRHGMSTGNLCRWFISQNNMKLNIFMVKYFVDPNHFISPSPNLPSNLSLVVYPGQCFWEATSFSEGRGTTRPFELFGHPNLTFDLAEQISYLFNKKYEGLAYLRPTYFIPVCHKHANTTCCGWQIFVKNKDHYHTLHGTLDMMKWVKKMGPGIDFWRVGKYEFDSDATAAQLLIGDDDLIAYVEGETKESYLLQKLHRRAVRLA